MNSTSVAGRTQLLRNNVYVRTISEWDNKVDPTTLEIESALRADAMANGVNILGGDERIVDGWL